MKLGSFLTPDMASNSDARLDIVLVSAVRTMNASFFYAKSGVKNLLHYIPAIIFTNSTCEKNVRK